VGGGKRAAAEKKESPPVDLHCCPLYQAGGSMDLKIMLALSSLSQRKGDAGFFSLRKRSFGIYWLFRIPVRSSYGIPHV
jgi:hypothetical protein